MKNMTIGQKLVAGFAALLLVVLCQSYSSLSASSTLSGELKIAVDKTSKKLGFLGDMESAATSMRSAQRGVVLFAMLKDKDRTEKARANFTKSVAEVNQLVIDLQPLVDDDSNRRDLATISTKTAEWDGVYRELDKLVAEGRFDEAMTSRLDKAYTLGGEVVKLSNGVQDREQELLKASSQRASELSARVRWFAFALILVALGVGAVVMWVVRGVSTTLRSVAHELGAGAAQVAAAASQVSASSQALAQGSSEQAASLEETSASSEEINSMAHRNSENSHAATALVDNSQKEFAQTNDRLELMVVAMDEINSSSDKISKIIKVIDEIAFQTNILALNAAVEAARAGEAGMGFAVVADEVRNLAQRCAQAAKDTAALIEESIAKSTDGKFKMDQVADAIRGITAESGKIKTLVDEVNLGSQEQVRGLDQISRAIVEMEKVTQSAAAHAEEGAAAAEELTAQSEHLRSISSHLTTLVGGGSGDARSASATTSKPARKLALKPTPLKAAKKDFSLEPVGAAHGKDSFPLDFEGESF